MGYSCRRDASDTVKAIERKYCVGESSNVFETGNDRFFFERGRENPDGAITGVVWRFLPDGKCVKHGSFRISPDGIIERFPGIPRKEYRKLEAAGREYRAGLRDYLPLNRIPVVV